MDTPWKRATGEINESVRGKKYGSENPLATDISLIFPDCKSYYYNNGNQIAIDKDLTPIYLLFISNNFFCDEQAIPRYSGRKAK